MPRTRTLAATAAALVATALAPAAAEAAAPANDSRLKPVVLAAAGGSHTMSNSEATYEAVHEGGRLGSGTHSVWYSWTAGQTGRVTFNTTAANFDTVLNVYAAYTTCCTWESDDDDGLASNASVTFDVTKGQEYSIAVDGFDSGDHGTFTIVASLDETPSPPGNDAFATPETLGGGTKVTRTLYQQFATQEPGEPQHRSKDTSSSRWYTWTPQQSGGTNFSTSCSNTSEHLTHKTVVAVYEPGPLTNLEEVSYTLYANGTCGFAQLQAVQGRTYVIAVDAEPGSRGRTALHVNQDVEAPAVTFTPQQKFGRNGAVPFTVPNDAARVQCSLDGGQLVDCPGGKLQLANAAGGPHKLRVHVADHHGNAGQKERTFEVDTTPADTSITSGPQGATRDQVSKVEFASEAGATFQCRVDGGAWQACTSPFASPFRPHGAVVKVEVRATDTFGNVDSSAAARSWAIDRVAPKVSLIGGEPSAPQGEAITWAFGADEPQVTFTCSLEYGPYQPCTSPFTAAGVDKETTHHLTVRATDAAGNETVAGWRGHQTKRPATTNTNTNTNTTNTGTNGTNGTNGTTKPSGTESGTTPLRVAPLRVPGTMSRRVLARRGVKVGGGCSATCVLTVELRAGRRLLVRKTVNAAGPTGTILLRGRPAVAAIIRRLKAGTPVVVTARAPGATAASARIRLTR